MQCNLMLQFKKICKKAHANGIPNSNNKKNAQNFSKSFENICDKLYFS